jgi:hypothetical protein
MSHAKRSACPVAAMCAFLATLLTGCATSNEVAAPSLPVVPSGLAACTDASVPSIPGPRGSPLTKTQSVEALADQRAAALDKDRCAKAWKAFYGDIAMPVGQI